MVVVAGPLGPSAPGPKPQCLADFGLGAMCLQTQIIPNPLQEAWARMALVGIIRGRIYVWIALFPQILGPNGAASWPPSFLPVVPADLFVRNRPPKITHSADSTVPQGCEQLY